MPGKGLGAVATRSIARGERILCEEPLVAWRSVADARGEHDFARLQALVDALAPSERRAFYSLSQSSELYGAARTARGVWGCNAYPCLDGLAPTADGVTRSAVFAHACRINHACHPSCHIAWHDGLGCMTVHALRSIQPGEELSVAYIGGDTLGTRASRQALLSRTYGFCCQCAACALRGDALGASEARQQRLFELHALLPAFPSNLPELVEELMALLRAEGRPLIWAKSPIFAALFVSRRMFFGFRSRCRMCFEWMCPSAMASWQNQSRICCSVNRFASLARASLIFRWRSPFSAYSVMMQMWRVRYVNDS